MPLWAAIRVILGAIVTLASTLLVAVVLPILVLVAAPVVGDSLPTWLFALPLLACPFAGGASTGFPRATDWTVDTFLGGLAAALGTMVVGGLFGLVLTFLIMKSMPAHGAVTADFSDIAATFGRNGAAIGFAVGAVLGALGGASGSALGRELRT